MPLRPVLVPTVVDAGDSQHLLSFAVAGRLSRVECGEICRPPATEEGPNLNSMSVAKRGGDSEHAAGANGEGPVGGVRGWLRQLVPLR
jgi:hypothetical protein